MSDIKKIQTVDYVITDADGVVETLSDVASFEAKEDGLIYFMGPKYYVAIINKEHVYSITPQIDTLKEVDVEVS